MKNILFVCTGNTCRSPMAEGFFSSAVSNDIALSKMFTTSSAGLYAYEGERATPNSINAVKNGWNIDISLHTAHSLNREAVLEAFLILTMTRQQKEALIMQYPIAKSKTFTLNEYAFDKHTSQKFDEFDFSKDIIDPFGGSQEVYNRCAHDINTAVEKLIDKLKFTE